MTSRLLWSVGMTLLLLAAGLLGLNRTTQMKPAIQRMQTHLAPYRLVSAPMPWTIYLDAPQTAEVYYYEIIQEPDRRNEVGHLTIVRYANPGVADLAYQAIRREAEYDKNVTPLDFADRGSQSGPAPLWNASDVLFQRCQTIVHVTLQDDTLPLLRRYAQGLDRSIEPIVCS